TILRVAEKNTLANEFEKDQKIKDSQLGTSPLLTEFIRLNYARASGSIATGSTTTGTTTSPFGGSSDSSAGGGASSGGSDPGILGIIKRRLSRRGAVEVDGRSNTLIITDVRENIDAIRQLVALLDQPEPQVEIEARIVVASRSFSRDIGVQLAGFVAGPRGSGGAGGTLPNNSSTLPLSTNIPNPGINNDLFSNIPNTVIGLTTGIFGTAQINLLISAGEKKGQAKVIATPRVTTLNNRPAEIKSGTKIPITTIQPGGSGTTPIATTTYVDVPLRLAITPQITDVGTVILSVVAENSSTAQIVAGAAPAINTQSMTTQVTVPDGGTTVVGGVLFDDEREDQNRTPGISKVPILGNLFKRKAVQRNTNEILFFITPRITKPDLSGAAGSSGVKTSGTIIQPVPLGNPPSNSDPNQVAPTPTPLPAIVPNVQAPAGMPTKP
ncbi:MAG: secretin N-terminal domain-containing protein, partial [Acidobacteriota bacterium]